MKAYEFILKGFDGSTDATDHLIKWVKVTDSLTGKLEELGQKIGAKVYPLAGVHVDDFGFDATIATNKQLIRFLASLK